VALLIGASLAACGQAEPEVPTGPRVWEGGTEVSSEGVVIHERREIAQKVPLPVCITVGQDRYRFGGVTPFAGGGAAPPGLEPTFYRLDRWSLWKRPGPLEGQPALFVAVRGSSGFVAEYQRVGAAEPCAA
jgi:hypothetical protein